MLSIDKKRTAHIPSFDPQKTHAMIELLFNQLIVENGFKECDHKLVVVKKVCEIKDYQPDGFKHLEESYFCEICNQPLKFVTAKEFYKDAPKLKTGEP